MLLGSVLKPDWFTHKSDFPVEITDRSLLYQWLKASDK